jgi:hypothetical protein
VHVHVGLDETDEVLSLQGERWRDCEDL